MELERRPSTFHKRYVKVRVDYHLDGRIVPLKFRTEDGPAVVIDQILDVRQAAALKAGGLGMRYTCRAGEQLFFLFHDRNWWFVEA
ncbi:MAG: hypothetical protein IJ507_02540 [Clostridia bacterium]|nr:hypothetical protein [Clostridia bacterium]